MTLAAPPDWDVRAFDPETDLLAPEDYEQLGLDPDHSCDGVSHDDPRLRSASAASRGWGPGHPDCQWSKWVTISRPDGLKLVVRKERAELTTLLVDETERLGYDLKPGWCWGAACRAIRGSTTASNHSWALADDLNAPENPMGPRNGRIRRYPAVIAVWKRYGFRWGGDYTGRADDMHFEYMGTPADLIEHTKRARAELGQEDSMAVIFDDVEEFKTAVRDVLDEEPTKARPKGMRYLVKLLHSAVSKAASGQKYPFFDAHLDYIDREQARQGRVLAALCKERGIELDEDGEPVP